MKKTGMALVTAVMVFVGLLTGSSFAEGPKVSGFASVDVMSNYIWRGIKVSNSMVVQPSVGITYGDFAANIWANYDSDVAEWTSNNKTGHGEITETDITLSYTKSINKLTLSGGYIFYAFEGYNDTQEFFVTASYDTLLNPALTVCYDFDEGNGAWVVASIGHTFSLPKDMSLKLRALASYNIENGIMGFDKDGNKFSNFYNAEVNAALTIPITKALSVTPKVAYSFAISNDAKDAMKGLANDGRHDILYGGVNLTLSF
ncbi:MAG: hypothetical protein Q8K68_13990 [Nitrospirota bacterium]|nr:hypothetical protein [Nitrospirota bacterium]